MRTVYAIRRTVAAIIAVLVGFLAFSAIGVVASHISDVGTPRFECHADSVDVEPGDTIWGIAEEHCNGNIGYVVYLIVEQRGSTEIHQWDTVKLPRGP